MRASVFVALLAAILPAAQQPSSPDAEGFIRDWLVLAPIAIEGESGASEEVFNFTDTRVLEKDTDRVDVALAKGSNVLVFKVVNEVNNWQACARFTKNGAPVKVRISLAPQG